jgi:hypothetical protein
MLSALNGETTNTNVTVFGLTRSGLEPIIYRTRGEHTNIIWEKQQSTFRVNNLSEHPQAAGLQLKVSGKNITGYSLFYEKVAGAIYKSFHLF